jgi:hypothetical protein
MSPREQNKQVWRELVARSANAELTLREFCDREGIPLASLKYWKHRFKGEGVVPTQTVPVALPKSLSKKSGFIPVRIMPEQRPHPLSDFLPPTLPDPKWVAELIWHLSRGSR